jgi:hypothetical protein
MCFSSLPTKTGNKNGKHDCRESSPISHHFYPLFRWLILFDKQSHKNPSHFDKLYKSRRPFFFPILYLSISEFLTVAFEIVSAKK